MSHSYKRYHKLLARTVFLTTTTLLLGSTYRKSQQKPVRIESYSAVRFLSISHNDDKPTNKEKISSPKKPTKSIRSNSSTEYHEFDDFDEDSQEFISDSEQKKRKKRQKWKLELYAELISDSGLPLELPPIKVIIHSAIAESAAVSIKDSHTLANELSKSLLLDLLNNPDSAGKFGCLLDQVFQYEALLDPTRQLIYWAVTAQPDVHYAMYSLTRYQLIEYMHYYLPALVSDQIKAWLLWPDTSATFFVPLLCDLARSRDVIIDPLADIVKESIPLVKEMALGELKTVIAETLKAEDTKYVNRVTSFILSLTFFLL